MEGKLKRQIEAIFNGREGTRYVGPMPRTRQAVDLPTVEWWRSRLRCVWLELHRDLVRIDGGSTRVQMFNATAALPAMNSIPDYVHTPAAGKIAIGEAN
jgi:hypothetical protein